MTRRVMQAIQGKDGSAGLTLVEVLVALAIMLILSGAIVPTVKFAVKRQKELELRHALRTMRQAIDEYKKFCDSGAIAKEGVDSECYPPDLDVLVEGVDRVGALGQKLKFLRRVPFDPFTKSQEWGKRSYQDDWDSTSWGQENVYDVYTTYEGKALDGTEYKNW
jgi:general secretion pathway protein G